MNCSCKAKCCLLKKCNYFELTGGSTLVVAPLSITYFISLTSNSSEHCLQTHLGKCPLNLNYKVKIKLATTKGNPVFVAAPKSSVD